MVTKFNFRGGKKGAETTVQVFKWYRTKLKKSQLKGGLEHRIFGRTVMGLR